MIVYRTCCIFVGRGPGSADKRFSVATTMPDGVNADHFLQQDLLTLDAAERFIDGYILGKLDGLAAGRALAADARELMAPVFIPEPERPE